MKNPVTKSNKKQRKITENYQFAFNRLICGAGDGS
jgi:hypothetical protein